MRLPADRIITIQIETARQASRYYAAVLLYLGKTALRQIKRYGTQSVLAILGVAIGVANIIVLISITDLGRHQTMGLINDLGANVIIVAPYVNKEGGMMANMSTSFSPLFIPGEAVRLIEDLPEISAVAPALLIPRHVSAGDVHVPTTVQGVTKEFSTLRGHDVLHGRWMTDADVDSKARVAFLGHTLASELFGDADADGKQVEIENEMYTVAGVMEHKGLIGLEDVDNRAYIPLSTVQEVFEHTGVHGLFAAYTEEAGEVNAISAVEAALRKTLGDGELYEETFTTFTIKEATDLMDDTLGVFRKVLLGIASIAMLVAGIGIMNVMLIQVMQRRHEIGIRRSVGATTATIVGQFLTESTVQAIIGALIGCALGLAGVYAYCQYSGWTWYVSPGTIALGMLFSIATGLLFGGYPAYRAARLDPVESLRMEN